MRFTVRELMLAIAIVAIFVGSFMNCQIVNRAMRATQRLATATSDAAK
jgi:type II secretory pathway component PulJ